ncbi:unnamed protein product [Prorocentrum cordatum]|uniref:Beta-galactosidase n=1 Tax=Prorocentrum cordatum TaxID=2364126 RepID=A0ABN9R3T7_9DINO|nr:unnamed protein product [Polarella glacialis]
MASHPALVATDADFHQELETEWPRKIVESLTTRSPAHSFSHETRMGPQPRSRPTTPGPADYRPRDRPARPVSAQGRTFGMAPRMGNFCASTEFPGTKDEEYFVPDASLKYAAPRRAVFGKSSRFDTASDLETQKACPQHKLLDESPGLLYEPKDEYTGGRDRPRSAGPAYRFARDTCERFKTKPATSLDDAPLGPSDCALGKQWNSKRRTTTRASSFSRASRFPSSKVYATEGELTAQCKQVPKFGDSTTGDRTISRRTISAPFGSSTREKSARRISLRAPKAVFSGQQTWKYAFSASSCCAKVGSAALPEKPTDQGAGEPIPDASIIVADADKAYEQCDSEAVSRAWTDISKGAMIAFAWLSIVTVGGLVYEMCMDDRRSCLFVYLRLVHPLKLSPASELTDQFVACVWLDVELVMQGAETAGATSLQTTATVIESAIVTAVGTAWPRYPGRRVLTLSGAWDFAFLGDVGHEAAASVREEYFCQTAEVPDAFDAREWLCPERCHRSDGRPCASCCEGGLGGPAPAGDHPAGCWGAGRAPERCCDAVALGRRGVAAYRTFRDNRFSPAWPVHQAYFDWYQPGGLLRPVEGHVLRDREAYVAALDVLPQRPLGRVTVRLRLSAGCAGQGLTAAAAFDTAGGAVDGPERAVGGDGLEEVWSARVPDPRPWSPGSPALHTLTVSLRRQFVELDRVTVRFGLRTIEAREGRVWLNGEVVELRGVNRHEWHPWKGGIFLPEEQLQGDLALLRELGANFVRGSHYAQDQRWLDLCDEAGILVWEESLGWQPKAHHLQDPLFVGQQMDSLEEMINASVNHPSVIFWGFLNEGEADVPEARLAYQALRDMAKDLDPTRLVTWASKCKMSDLTLDLADVISFNDYPGWYDASVEEIPSVWRQYVDWARLHHGGKPVVVSEVGGDGLANFRSRAQDMWSEDLQAAIVRASIVAAASTSCAGIALWQLTDSRVDVAPFLEDNPRASPMAGVPDADWVEEMAVRFQGASPPCPPSGGTWRSGPGGSTARASSPSTGGTASRPSGPPRSSSGALGARWGAPSPPPWPPRPRACTAPPCGCSPRGACRAEAPARAASSRCTPGTPPTATPRAARASGVAAAIEAVR